MNEEIGKLLAKAEQLGAEGNVDEAQKVLQEVEKVRTRKKDAEVRKHYSRSICSLVECSAPLVLILPSSDPSTPLFSVCVSLGRVQKLDAGFQLPAAEASGV